MAVVFRDAAHRAEAIRRALAGAGIPADKRRLVFELEGAFSVIDSINPRFDSTRTELESNRRVVDAFREQLFAANRSLLDVLDAYQRLYQSKVDLTTLLVSETRTKLQLAHLSGRLYRLLPEIPLPK